MNTNGSSCCADGDQAASRTTTSQGPLRYRIGTHSSFFRSMVASLSSQTVPPGDDDAVLQPLRALSTRALDDGTMALLDAWAASCDVLSFYSERMFQEGFLSTAVEHLSVFQIARGIGYQPRPGASASTYLAFQVEDVPGAPSDAQVPIGTAILSVPGQDEVPQTFETTEALDAKAAWNAMRAQQLQTQRIEDGSREIYLQGFKTRLAPGDPIVLFGESRLASPNAEDWDFRFVAAVEERPERDWTKVTLDRPLGDPPRTSVATTNQRVLTFRGRGSLFGFNAPDFRVMSEGIRTEFGSRGGNTWDGFTFAHDSTLNQEPSVGSAQIDLDTEYPKIAKDSWVVLEDRRDVELYRVLRASPSSRSDFTLTAKCTRLALDGEEHLARFLRRSTVVHLQSEELKLSRAPRSDCVTGLVLELEPAVPALPAGRSLIVKGTEEASGEVLTELVVVKSATVVDGVTRVTLVAPLARCYVRSSVQIFGNVVPANHGETVGATVPPIVGLPPGVVQPETGEVLGGGNAAVPHRSFSLRERPLTFVTAVTPSGVASTLEIRVGGVLWQATDTLLTAGPNDRVYELHVDYDGRARIQFGDGMRGARPATGKQIVAKYRKGLGLGGEVRAEQLSIMPKRPLGIRSGTNPTSAGGGADPDALEDIRRNAPLTVLTLDRLVALQDYEDFARAFAGVGKAKATELWDGKRTFVHVTVASASGAVLSPADALLPALVAAYEKYQDPSHVVVVSPHVNVTFGARVKLLPDGTLEPELVEAFAREALRQAFVFARRDFGQSVHPSTLITTLQESKGVKAVDLDALFRSGHPAAPLLVAARASWTGGSIARAELLLLDDNLVQVGWMS